MFRFPPRDLPTAAQPGCHVVFACLNTTSLPHLSYSLFIHGTTLSCFLKNYTSPMPTAVQSPGGKSHPMGNSTESILALYARENLHLVSNLNFRLALCPAGTLEGSRHPISATQTSAQPNCAEKAAIRVQRSSDCKGGCGKRLFLLHRRETVSRCKVRDEA